jgi:hypothetical protein
MSDPYIPQELVKAFLEFLLEEHPESLHHCALVSRSWLHPAQSCIFSTISLGVGLQDGFALGLVDAPPLSSATNLYQSFSALLATSSHLAGHVRTLNLGLRPLQSDVVSSDALSTDD